MVAASKYVTINEICSELKCKDLYHSWTPSCLASTWDISQRSLKGSIQFFTSMYMLQLILYRRKLSREYLKRHAKDYVRSVLVGNLIGSLSVSLCCVMRGLLGGFYQYTTFFIPATLGGFVVLLERQEKQEFYICALFTLALEYLVRQLVRAGKLRLTRLRMCAWFMLLNSAAMYLMRNDGTEKSSGNTYWFFIPPRAEKRNCERGNGSDRTNCNHSGSCWSHVFQEATKYLGYGLAVQMLRVLVPQFRGVLLHPTEKLHNLCVRKNFLLGMFFGGYVGIYQAVICLLSQLRGRDAEVHAVPAGLLAGAAFWYYPELTTLLTVGTTVLQQLIKRGLSLGTVPRSGLLMSAIFSVLFGTMVHCRIVDKEICHPVFIGIMRTFSGGRSDECHAIYERLQDNYHKRKFL